MTDKAILENLKDPLKVKQYNFCLDNEKALLKKAKKAEACLALTAPGGYVWIHPDAAFISSEYYLIDPKWQPEPEFEYALIEECNGMLGIRNDDVEGKGRPYPLSSSSGFVYLYIIPSIPSFVKFVDEEKKGLVFAEVVARRWRRGDLTYAQFIKGAE